MKILFIDEIKDVGILKSSELKGYGLVCTLMDIRHYRDIKENFSKHLKDFPGYVEGKEIKGSSLFSGLDVKKNVAVMKKILSLSRSKSGKTSKFQTYVNFDLFNTKVKEEDCYIKCLENILNKFPKNNEGINKSLIILVADENNCFGKTHASFNNTKIGDILASRNYFLFEKCLFTSTDNFTAGVLLSDYVGYIFKSLLNFSLFNKKNKDHVLSLIQKEKRTKKEESELSNHLISYKKSNTCKELMNEIKKVIII